MSTKVILRDNEGVTHTKTFESNSTEKNFFLMSLKNGSTGFIETDSGEFLNKAFILSFKLKELNPELEARKEAYFDHPTGTDNI